MKKLSVEFYRELESRVRRGASLSRHMNCEDFSPFPGRSPIRVYYCVDWSSHSESSNYLEAILTKTRYYGRPTGLCPPFEVPSLLVSSRIQVAWVIDKKGIIGGFTELEAQRGPVYTDTHAFHEFNRLWNFNYSCMNMAQKGLRAMYLRTSREQRPT